jgi:hypothetical protein
LRSHITDEGCGHDGDAAGLHKADQQAVMDDRGDDADTKEARELGKEGLHGV